MRTDHGGGVPGSTTFAQTLSALKREGSSILLVGRTSATAHRAACSRLMGDSGEPRQRLYVYTTGTETCGQGPSTDHQGTTRILSQENEAGVSASPKGVPDDIEETVVGPQLLSTLGTSIIDAVDEMEADHELEPAELRLCFDSVTPLLQEHKSQNVFRLLHMVTSRTRQADGMGHFHLPLDRDSDYVRLLEPLFDAVVEVRRTEDGDEERLEQRWHLRDRDAESGWIEI
ncbi:DUF7504 family protein [Haloarchaeobius litoreus]|uniref:Uncharacterized protein n=1 Tax=Haloarchaeobius litoreus TaxID=755306 RepID=A0ABD6DJQ9_9EURY|nr:hypothetical protein [Haloarchaeobius litoreus]